MSTSLPFILCRETTSSKRNINSVNILISGSEVTISNSSIFNHKYGIELGGDRNKVINTKIIMERNSIPDSDISGILISGRNNWIENSEISGYFSKNNIDASDISISNKQNNKRLLSAKIINTTLLDPQPFYFGSPANEESFLEIYGYDAPFAQTRLLPENFIDYAVFRNFDDSLISSNAYKNWLAKKEQAIFFDSVYGWKKTDPEAFPVMSLQARTTLAEFGYEA